MSDIVSPLLQWLNTHPELSGLVTFIISAAESVAIVGTIVPGSIMMTALGVLAGSGVIPLWPTLIWAILGAIMGDGISYWIGYYFKDRLPKHWPFRKHPSLLQKGELFFKKYGSMSVFMGRFVGPVRALVPLVAGMLGMKPLQFTIANITSAIGWAPVYMLPGILLGAASLELPADIAVHVILVLFLFILFALLCLWFTYKLYQLIQAQISQTQDNLWRWLKKSPHFSPITILLKDHDPTQTHGQLNLTFYFILTSLLFLSLAIYIKFVGANTLLINEITFHFFRGIRTDMFNHLMLDITLIAQKEVILPLLATLFIWLLLCKRRRTALHIFILGLFAAGSVFTIKNIVRSPRPWGIFHSPETYSMPSGHTILSTAIYLTITYLIAQSLRPAYRTLLYYSTLFLLLIVGISRLYLGAHWLTDVMAGWLMGAAILMFILISYRREAEAPINPLGILTVTLVTLIITYSTFCYFRYSDLHTAYTQINWPTKQIRIDDWWKNDNALMSNRTSLFGMPTQPINIEWAGNINQIKTILIDNGWNKPPARDWVSTLHRIADVSSAQYLPMISPQYLDKKPEVIFTQQVPGEKNLLIIRLWKANCFIQDSRVPLWVGTIGFVPSTYGWLYKEHKRKNASELVSLAHLFPHQAHLNDWQYKMMTVTHITRKDKRLERNIILLRPATQSP